MSLMISQSTLSVAFHPILNATSLLMNSRWSLVVLNCIVIMCWRGVLRLNLRDCQLILSVINESPRSCEIAGFLFYFSLLLFCFGLFAQIIYYHGNNFQELCLPSPPTSDR